MTRIGRILTTMVTVLVVGLTLATSAPAESGSSLLTDEEEELLAVEDNVIELRRALSAARHRGDDPEELKKLEKRFDKLQKKRGDLLRATWQM